MRLVQIYYGRWLSRVLQCPTCYEVTVVPFGKRPKAGDLCSVCLESVLS